jgi:hypothetical protein
MNKSQRIYLDTGTTQTDKYITTQLEQDVDTIEFMSMSIYTKDAYQDFNSDYGVLVGRVLANGGVGIPNAKISIFIPLTDTDAQSGTTASIYPYKTPRDKNAQGKRYNLLPRVSEYVPSEGIYKPKQPFGSFPIKPEIVTNQDFLDVYKKYYKYTALTNSAGDYMIFGVPIGTQTVHLSVDITDIGKYSMTPAAMVVNLGYSPNLFYDNSSKIKPSSDLNDLPNIETQEISVDIVSFWGDTTNFTIGITRQDFRIRSILNNTFVIFGSAFTDDTLAMWGTNAFNSQKIDELYTMGGDADAVYRWSIQTKRIGIISEKIYYYPASVSDADIDSGNVDPKTQMVVLDPSQYSIYKRDGDFIFIISCNRNKVITDDFGNQVLVSNDSVNGIFTKFRGFMTLEITQDSIPMDWSVRQDKQTFIPTRTKLKFPQTSPNGQGLSMPGRIVDGVNVDTYTENWRKQHYTFSGGTIYSIAKFNGTVYLDEPDNNKAAQNGVGDLEYYSRFDSVNIPYNKTPGRDSGIILTGDVPDIVSGNTEYEMVNNSTMTDGSNVYKLFGGNWLNLCAYLPQYGYVSSGYAYINHWRSNTNYINWWYNKDPFFYVDNTQPIAAGQFNTKWFARTDLHWTDFIQVPKTDILKMAIFSKKGFLQSDIIGSLAGNTYRNGANVSQVPFQGGKLNGNLPDGQDPNTYFYKGVRDANCIDYIISLGLV